MPLHLLQKKSWNPYNPAAIARVRADEEAAAAREEAEEQRQQQQDADRRLAILRGVTPPPLEDAIVSGEKQSARNQSDGKSYKDDWRRKRRRVGEDDTDREIRLARQDVLASRDSRVLEDRKPKKGEDVSLTDHNGHIQLFAPRRETAEEKNAEAEAEKKKKEREWEDQYTMRFSNAAGFKQSVGAAPWYASGSKAGLNEEEAVGQRGTKVGTNVWGREDSGRASRDEARITSADPMAVMKKAQSQLKTVARERNRWRREREQELEELKQDEQRHRRRRHAREEDRRWDDGDELDGFSLDAPEVNSYADKMHNERRRKSRDSRSRRHRRRSRSPERRR